MNKKQIIKDSILIFISPILILTLAFFLLKLPPFGDNSIFYIDLPAQITYFYDYFYQTLTGDKSILYSFNYGMGNSFWATYAYYLSSPLSFLIILYKFIKIPFEFYPIIIWGIKLCLSGLTMSILLREKFTKKRIIIYIFSIYYAFIGFSITYFFLPMWIDTVYFLPLVILGVYNILEDDKNQFFTIFLCLMFIANFYTSYMAGIFTFLYFCCTGVSLNLNKKQWVKKLRLFFISVVWAILFSLFITLPTLEVIKENSYTSGTFKVPSVFSFSGSFSEVYKSFFNGLAENQNLSLYVGLFSLLLLFTWFFNSKIKRKEKISYGILLVFLITSLCNDFLIYMWHVFEEPNGAFFRFSFVISFLIILMAAKSFDNFDGISKYSIIASFIFNLILLMLIPDIQAHKVIFPVNIILLVSFSLILGVLKKQHLAIFLVVPMLLVDVTANTTKLLKDYPPLSNEFYTLDEPNYSSLLSEIKSNDHNYYRIMIDPELGHLQNESLKQDYHAIDIYTSTSNFSVNNFLGDIGYNASARAVSTNYGFKLSNSLFSVKYFITKNKLNDTSYKLLYQKDDLYVYKNLDSLPFGYPIDSNFLKFDKNELNKLERQNQLIDKNNQKVYNYEGANIKLDNVEKYTDKNNIGYLKNKKIGTPASVEYEINVTSPKDLFLQLNPELFSSPELFNKIKIDVNGNPIVNSKLENSIYLGSFKNENITVKLTLLEENQEIIEPQIYSLDQDVLREQTSSYFKEPLKKVKIKNNELSAKVQLKTKSQYFLSIPYDKNWKLYVDGKEHPYSNHSEFITFDMDKGSHDILLKYKPTLFWLSVGISGVSFIIYILINTIRYKKNKR